MTVDGSEQSVCDICELASDVMNSTRMPAGYFDNRLAQTLRDRARELAKSVQQEREVQQPE
jgi:gas vesicle protein